MNFPECIDCELSLVCVSKRKSFGYCSSLKRRVLIVGHEGDEQVVLAPKSCPQGRDKYLGNVCTGDHGNDQKSMCGQCAVTVAVLRETLKEEKELVELVKKVKYVEDKP